MAHADVRGVGAFGGGGKCGVICKGQEVPLTQSGDLPASQRDLRTLRQRSLRLPSPAEPSRSEGPSPASMMWSVSAYEGGGNNTIPPVCESRSERLSDATLLSALALSWPSFMVLHRKHSTLWPGTISLHVWHSQSCEPMQSPPRAPPRGCNPTG